MSSVPLEPGLDEHRYVPSRKKRRSPRPRMQPPLTPMIDVTFQLLLFFLLTFTFREAEGLIPGTLPKGDVGVASLTDQPSVYIRVRPAPGDPMGAVFEVKGESRQFRQAGELYTVLESRKAASGSERTPVIIEPRGDVLWEHVVNAFNQAVRARYVKIGFASSG
jgi:biopolymer transport protein ExbD